MGRQDVVIDIGFGDRLEGAHVAELGPPRTGRRGLAHALVARRVVVARHLHGKHATLGDHPGEPREQRRVVADPLHRRVGEDQIGHAWRRPLRDVGLDPVDLGIGLARLGEHRGGIVDAGDRRAGPARLEQAGHAAVAATEVKDAADVVKRDVGEQVVDRALTLGAELAVLRGIPNRPRHGQSTAMSAAATRRVSARRTL